MDYQNRFDRALRKLPPHVPASAPIRNEERPMAETCCDRCGSVRLIRVKACWRCEACGYKSDCNGW